MKDFDKKGYDLPPGDTRWDVVSYLRCPYPSMTDEEWATRLWVAMIEEGCDWVEEFNDRMNPWLAESIEKLCTRQHDMESELAALRADKARYEGELTTAYMKGYADAKDKFKPGPFDITIGGIKVGEVGQTCDDCMMFKDDDFGAAYCFFNLQGDDYDRALGSLKPGPGCPRYQDPDVVTCTPDCVCYIPLPAKAGEDEGECSATHKPCVIGAKCQQDRAKKIAEVKGKYAGCNSTVDEFLADKHGGKP